MFYIVITLTLAAALCFSFWIGLRNDKRLDKID